jgi:hypothetical protein
MVAFSLHEVETVDAHAFAVFDCAEDDTDVLAAEIAERVRALYVDTDLVAEFEAASAGLEDLVDPASLIATARRVVEAVVPQPGANPNQPAHLDLPRNELAEVLASELLEHSHGALVPASRVRQKEVPGLPTRGIDVVGLLLEPELKLVVAEVKASSSASSPPAVVGDGNDCMHAQVLKLVADEKKQFRELNWMKKHATSETAKQHVTRAMLLLGVQNLPVVAAPVLVRPRDRYTPADFGCFKDTPDNYSPATVHFSVVRVPGTLEELAGAAYTKARELP